MRPSPDLHRRILPPLAFLLLAVGITIAAAIHVRGFERDLRSHVEREIATIADLKVTQIVEWRRRVIADAAELGTPRTAAVLQGAVQPGADPAMRAEALRRIQLRVDRQGLERGAVVDRAGRPLLSTDPQPVAEGEELQAIQRGLDADGPVLVDLGSAGGAIRVVVPVRVPGRAPLAVVMSGWVEVSLQGSVRAWPTPSRSAEAFLAAVHGDEVVILDALRFTGGTPYPPSFRLTGAHFPLALAARGDEGTGRHFDHRGRPVLAARRRIPDSNWVLSAKVNEEELLAPAEERARSLSLAVAAILAASGAALVFWWRAERTALSQREAELRQRERVERLQYMWKHALDVVVITDAEGRIVDANDRAVELYGYRRDELLQLRIADLRTDAERIALPAVWERIRATPGGVLVETEHRRRDGTAVPVEAGLRLVESEHGRFVYCIIRDITERRKAEAEVQRQEERLRAAQAQLAFSDRLASIGTLAAGVAHEINNPLAYVLSNLEYLHDALRGCRDGTQPGASRAAELEGAVEESREGVRRIAEIVRTLRTFSRHERTRSAPPALDLRDPVRAAIRMAASEIRARARLEVDLAAVPPVAAPEHELAQIAVNLLVNAAQAIPEGRETENAVTVRTRADGAWVVLEVEDTGAGIPPEILKRIFDPFFTTKPVGEGTGLGLSVCLGIVEGLGGRIEVDSHQGRGTVFRVRLPPAASSGRPAPTPAASPANDPQRDARGKRRRIVVIDDDPLVGRAVARTLSEHDVLVLTDSVEAVQRLGDGEDADLVLCDLMMPGVSGMDCWRVLSERRPSLARSMVFLTGGAYTEATRTFLGQVENDRVEKPFDLEDLRRVVARALAA